MEENLVLLHVVHIPLDDLLEVFAVIESLNIPVQIGVYLLNFRQLLIECAYLHAPFADFPVLIPQGNAGPAEKTSKPDQENPLSST